MSDTERIDRSRLAPDNHDTDIAALHEGAAVTPENVIDALSKLVLDLPEGLHVFQILLEGEQMYLKETTAEISGSSAQFIEVVRYNNGIHIGHLNTIRHGSRSSTSDLRLEVESGSVQKVHFYLTDNHKMLGAHYHAGEGLVNAWVFFPLVGNSTALVLNYLGDGQGGLRLSEVNRQELTAEQIQLLLTDGKVPEINLQQLIYSWITSGSNEALHAIVADLTFDPQAWDYNPHHSHVYLAKTVMQPSPEVGAVVKGVAVTQEAELPFGIEVEIQVIEEVDFEYTSGLGKAVEVGGKIFISDGVGGRVPVTKTFTIHSSLVYLKQHMELILGEAFATFSLAELMEMS